MTAAARATTPEPASIDTEFGALPLHALRDAALSRGRDLGAEHVDFRCQRNRSSHLQVRDGRPSGAEDVTEIGLAVRVVWRGAWGFASDEDLTTTAAARAAERAVELARLWRGLDDDHVELASEPIYRDATWATPCERNPFEVPEAERLAVLVEWSERLLAAHGVDHVHAKMRAAQEDKFYADSAGTTITQQRVRIYPQVTAVALDSDGSVETMRTLGPPIASGWEYVSGRDWDWERELAALPEHLAERRRAPSVTGGVYDLVIDASNLWLTVHESVGHATELDRMLGCEAAYAGTSFATVESLGRLRYGSPLMQVTADRTAAHGLATVGYDDEGVAAQSWDIVRDGTLVGCQVDRRMARLLGLGRSNGCAFADSARHAPLQRMPNVSLRPSATACSVDTLIGGVRNGIYVVGDKSWSIDMERRNFQFTGQRFYAIRRGRLVGQVRDAAYQATTTDFWSSLEGVGGPETYGLFGADLCGKGQPGQLAAASHGCPAAVFRDIQVLDTRREQGR